MALSTASSESAKMQSGPSVDASAALTSSVFDADGISALAPKRIYCGHCTGTRGFVAISARNRDVVWLACGMRVEL